MKKQPKYNYLLLVATCKDRCTHTNINRKQNAEKEPKIVTRTTTKYMKLAKKKNKNEDLAALHIIYLYINTSFTTHNRMW